MLLFLQMLDVHKGENKTYSQLILKTACSCFLLVYISVNEL